MDPSDCRDDRDVQPAVTTGAAGAGGTGTRRGSRDYILDAARKLFAEKGFQGVSVRAIAKEAEVDPALVHYFYSTKGDVFTAAVGDLCDVEGLLERVRSAPKEQVAERLVTVFLQLWESPGVREPLLAVARSAVDNEEANEALTDFLDSGLVTQVVAATGASDPDRRAALVTAQLMGAVMMRYVMRVEPLAGLDHDTLVARLTVAVEQLLALDLTMRPRAAERPQTRSLAVGGL